MSNALRLFVAVFLCARSVPAQSPALDGGAKPLVLQKNDGQLRIRRPREGVASPSSDFLLKIGPKTSGSKHLLLFTEEIPPGGGYSEAQTPPPVESPEHVFARTNYESVQQQFEDSQKEYDDRKQKEERCQAFPVEHPVTPESVDQHMVGCSYQTRKSRFVMEKVSEALAHYRTQLNDVDVCVKTYKDTIDKKLSDQTTREVGQIKTCQAEDLYPPATNDTKR